jgi:putative ABC transport system permease protein
MLWEAVKLAMQSVRRNALRSILTLLGIVIGVGAVIAMVTIGDGTTQKVTADLAKLGSNMLIARPGRITFGPGGTSAESRPFNERDVAKLTANLGGVRVIAPASVKTTVVVYGNENYEAVITGTDQRFFIAQDWTLASGRVLTEGDVRSGTSVCVIGETIRRELFGAIDPVGQRLRAGSFGCDIVGLLNAKGQSAFGNDQDNVVIIPLRTFFRRISGNTRIATIYISVAQADDVARVKEDAERLFREIRRVGPGEEDTFTVRDMTQVASTLASTSALMTALLGAVAAVSLLVGGIGIMNIMLVSVTERTREIGIRLAIGAVGRQVLTQFLVEAIVLALFGGIIGIFVGLAIAGGASYGMEIPFQADSGTIALAFFFSAAIGVIFGFFPARRAARLDPIEALRHE